MVPPVSLACQPTPSETPAQRIARIAVSPAAQAVLDQAPPPTRGQIDTLRATFAPAAVLAVAA